MVMSLFTVIPSSITKKAVEYVLDRGLIHRTIGSAAMAVAKSSMGSSSK